MENHLSRAVHCDVLVRHFGGIRLRRQTDKPQTHATSHTSNVTNHGAPDVGQHKVVIFDDGVGPSSRYQGVADQALAAAAAAAAAAQTHLLMPNCTTKLGT
jgi:hypothetical protein